MRILFLSARHPYPAHRGDERRVLHLVRELASHADVTLCSFGTGPPLPSADVRVCGVSRSVASTLRENVRHTDPRLPLQVRLFLERNFRRLVQREIAGFNPDVVHATTARMAPYLAQARSAHRHLDLVDPLSVNMADASRHAVSWKRPAYRIESTLLRRYEAAAVAQADSVSLVSEVDRQRAPGLTAATVVANGVDLRAFPHVPATTRDPVVLFFGNLGYVHNVPSAEFVAREVMPRVRERVATAQLRLVGARPDRAVRRLAGSGVHVVGEVDDMAGELHAAAAAVLPVLSGSGIKNKVLEAFAAGTPVVSNRRGVEGISGAVAGRHYLHGETPAEIADACVRLLCDQDERVRLGHEALALVRERYSWASQVRVLLALYRASGRE